MRPEPPLQLDARFTHVVESGDHVILVGDEDAVLLEGASAGRVIRLIDGRRNPDEIAAALTDEHRPELVHYALLQLEDIGVIATERVEAEGCATTTDHAGPLVCDLADELEAAWRGRATDRPVVRVSLARYAETLLLTDDYLRLAASDLVDLAGRPALLVRVGRRSVWVGPRIVPGVTACLECLQERLRLNLAARALVHVDTPASDLEVRAIPRPVTRSAITTLAEAFVDTEAIEDLDGLLAVDLSDASREAHPVDRLPHCSACGDPNLAPPGAAVSLERRERVAGSGGGYRTRTPRETLNRYSRLVSPLTGVVRRIQKVVVPDADPVHVYTASHASHFRASVSAVKAGGRDHSGGKGATDLDARVSALCESLERFSAVHRGHEPMTRGRATEVERAVAPNELLLFSSAQFDGRDDWNDTISGTFHWVPEPYSDEVIDWSDVRSLVDGAVWRIPSAYVFLGFQGAGTRFCKGDSNGLAGGNCLEEAVLQGLLELVERDAVALWWYNRVQRPGVDLASALDPYVDRVMEYHRSLGRWLWAIDLTTDLGIPTFAALSARDHGDPQDIVFGFGSHVDATIALRRAVTEVNQMLVTVLRSPEERRRQLLPDFADAIEWWDTASLADHPYLRPRDDRPATSLAEHQTPETDDLLDVVRHCVDRVARSGVDVLVHDLSRRDVGFAVAKIVAPGLRHFWRRLGPGRLYQLPVELGWLPAIPEEATMNPVSMFA